MPQIVPTKIKLLLFTAILIGTPANDSVAASTTPLTLNYSLAARVKLNISPATINFADADPTMTPLIPANENPITVTAYFRKDPAAALTATLVCQGGPLASASGTIPSANISWTATGSGFTSGTLSSTIPQSVGSWTTSGIYSGNLNFSLANLWSYTVGDYSGNITYTLTAP